MIKKKNTKEVRSRGRPKNEIPKGTRSGKVYGAISEKQRLILSDTTTDVLFVGGGAGGGKSMISLLKNLDGIHDPHFRCTIFRRTAPQLQRQGGLIDESQALYNDFYGDYGSQLKTWTFPSGSKISFSAISSDSDLSSWQGSQLVRVGIDEVCEDWTQKQVLFLMSRMRSAKSKIHPQMVLTGNPNQNSFLKSWVDYSLDPDTGVPVEGTENRVRWFVVIQDQVLWADSREECYELHGKPRNMVDGYGLSEEEIKKIPPMDLFICKSFKFIPTGVMDNPYLLPPRNTSYLANLLSQTKVHQLIFLSGSWTARQEGSMYWQRDWVTMVDTPPTNPVARIRAWDIAATEKTATNDPDWTCGVLMSRDAQGIYYIEDEVRFQKSTHDVLEEIIKTAKRDGIDDVQVCIPQDSGAAGKTAFAWFSRCLAEHGIYVRKSVMSGHSGKLNRFKPFCALTEGGSVRVVRAPWNEGYFHELESFTGERSNRYRFDDRVDASSDAFNALARQVTMPTFSIPQLTQPSPVVKM